MRQVVVILCRKGTLYFTTQSGGIMDFNLANEMADRIARGDMSCSFDDLVSMCIPYLLGVRSRSRFRMIPVADVINELAADAVSDAIMIQQEQSTPFSFCLKYVFLQRCHQRGRFFLKHTLQEILDQCEVTNCSKVIGLGPRRPSAEAQLLADEERQLFREELERHELFSKKLIYQRLRGSTVEELSQIFGREFNECKRVFWHDYYQIKDRINRQHCDRD